MPRTSQWSQPDAGQDGLAVIQSLWVGDRLTALERLSIQSFLDHGHAVRLYAYRELPDLPAGAVLCDGNEILAESQVFQYRSRPTFAAFSNFFRYKLLLERGGFWVDTDLVCLRPFAFPPRHVFASERVRRRDRPGVSQVVTSCVIGAPPASAAMAAAWQTCLGKDRGALEWGEVGPPLVEAVVAAQGLERFVEEPDRFCPVSYRDWRDLIAAQPPDLPPTAYAVHFWNEMWRLAGLDKDAAYPPTSLYETLKRRHPARTGKDSAAATSRADGSPGGIV